MSPWIRGRRHAGRPGRVRQLTNVSGTPAVLRPVAADRRVHDQEPETRNPADGPDSVREAVLRGQVGMAGERAARGRSRRAASTSSGEPSTSTCSVQPGTAGSRPLEAGPAIPASVVEEAGGSCSCVLRAASTSVLLRSAWQRHLVRLAGSSRSPSRQSVEPEGGSADSVCVRSRGRTRRRPRSRRRSPTAPVERDRRQPRRRPRVGEAALGTDSRSRRNCRPAVPLQTSIIRVSVSPGATG
jgi:hypothetical protein